MKSVDLTGQRFGSRLVLNRVSPPKICPVRWSVRCDCGDISETTTWHAKHSKQCYKCRGVSKTHCKHGHEYTPENTRISKTGSRHCKKCYYLTANLKKYGLTEDKYLALLRKRGGVCAISGLRAGSGRKYLAVDHDHSTGMNRGLLHSEINTAIGLFQENPEWLRRAADYIEHWRGL